MVSEIQQLTAAAPSAELPAKKSLALHPTLNSNQNLSMEHFKEWGYQKSQSHSLWISALSLESVISVKFSQWDPAICEMFGSFSRIKDDCEIWVVKQWFWWSIAAQKTKRFCQLQMISVAQEPGPPSGSPHRGRRKGEKNVQALQIPQVIDKTYPVRPRPTSIINPLVAIGRSLGLINSTEGMSESYIWSRQHFPLIPITICMPRASSTFQLEG